MRLICTISSEKSEENPYAFSNLLTSKGIENSCEEVFLGQDPPFYRIWAVDEDKVSEAQALYEQYQLSPQDFPASRPPPPKEKEAAATEKPPTSSSRFLSPAPYGKISLLIIFTTILLFFWGQLQKGVALLPSLKGIAEAPSLPPIDKKLLFDYPRYFELRDTFFTLYTPAMIKAKEPVPAKAAAILQQMHATPFWPGAYEITLKHFTEKLPLTYQGPLFEKISQGDYYRLFTPTVMHFNLLHIFFNLLWFIILGNQIEFRIGKLRYLFLILTSAILANVGQYLMSGSFFMGLSGVVVALGGFIWARQQIAPWEGYLLNRSTLFFLMAFVLGMFALSLILFLLAILGKFKGDIPIANTAHLVGGLTGYLLGRLKLFSLRRSR